ncbi:MAG: FtsQ-type POTRA domain-containing protein [Spirochaetales bacterium]|nr:FtsQ-type POTRA domain-containing protein [Spirochaetales bacterium]
MAELAFADRDFARPRLDTQRADRRSVSQKTDDEEPGTPALFAVVRAALVVALIVATLMATMQFAILPAMEITSFVVNGAQTVDATELRAWSGVPDGARWHAVDCQAVAVNVASHPRVASAVVERRFPDTVAVTVVERSPLAVVYARGSSGRIEAHCVDGAGVVFAPASMYPGAPALPVLSGVEIRGLRYGIKLEEPFTSLLASLSVLSGTEPALVAALSELRIVPRDGSPAELLVYPARYRIPVRMRPVLDASLLKSMMLVLDVVEGEGLAPAISELDLRTDTFVYRTKEAVSG